MLLMVSAKAEGHTYRVHTAGQIALGVKNNILGIVSSKAKIV